MDIKNVTRAWARLFWLRTETSRKILRTWYWSSELHSMGGFFLLLENLTRSQKWLFSVDLVI